MRDIHFYTRALKLNPEKAGEYYCGRAEFYFLEQEYGKAYSDLLKAKECGIDVENISIYYACRKYKYANRHIEKLSNFIKTHGYSEQAYYERFLLNKLTQKYENALSDLSCIIEHSSNIDYKKQRVILCKAMQTYYVNEMVNHAKTKKDKIEAYKTRIRHAQENILKHEQSEYWEYKAKQDLQQIYDIANDKALALFLRVNFYERIKNSGNAIMWCKQVIEKSQKQNNTVATYLYKTKLISLYVNNNEREKAVEIAETNQIVPVYHLVKKELEYINKYANTFGMDVLRNNIRTDFRRNGE